MKIGIPLEDREQVLNENRVSATPDSIKKILKNGFTVIVEKSAGNRAGFSDEDYANAGAQLGSHQEVFACDLVLKINPPTLPETELLKAGSYLISPLNSYENKKLVELLAQKKINAFAMERLPRTSRAQSMDILSSQANIAGYRAVLEATKHYKKFFPLMMTSAGMAKPAKLIVLGAGVAGLQAIATAKRLGAQVEAYDIRPEVKEQIESLGAKFIEFNLQESGVGAGGYAKELSEEGKKEQQRLLTEKLKTADIIITTASIPGRKAPTLITRDAVEGMRRGSVIIDMAAATGGNCEMTRGNEIAMTANGVTIVGLTNYPALVATDASQFFANNLYNFLSLLIKKTQEGVSLNVDFNDDIVSGTCVCHNGQVRI